MEAAGSEQKTAANPPPNNGEVTYIAPKTFAYSSLHLTDPSFWNMQILLVSWVKETLCEVKLGWGVLSPGPEKDSAVPGATWGGEGGAAPPAYPSPPTCRFLPGSIGVRARVRVRARIHACVYSGWRSAKIRGE